uniref:Uncharacterized protein n=2 Tax=Bradyrhizobium septentrionale TaxID=1404411 RepID=A0A973W2Y2_9BRAD
MSMLHSVSISSPKGPALRLAEDFLERLGLTCILIDRLPGASKTRMVSRRIAAMKARGTKVWFRTEREAAAVLKQLFEANRQIQQSRDGLMVAAEVEAVVELVRGTAFCAGITPIEDCDVTTTFASVARRVEEALARWQRDGTMKRINREYTQLKDRVHRTHENREAYDALTELYNALDRADRDRLKAEYKSRKEGSPKLSWSAFLGEKFAKATIKEPGQGAGSQGHSQGHSAGQSGDNGTSSDVPLDESAVSYTEWLVKRLGSELSSCTSMVHFTKT